MNEIDFLDTHPGAVRDYDARAKEKTPERIRIAKQFGKEFFDGDRLYGYGGYRYDGRWVKVAKKMKEHYGLKDDAKILDIGCAKGFLLHDFLQIMPQAEVAGIDVSKYAIDTALDTVKPFLKVCSAEKLPYPDDFFDLVISINSIHNLPKDALKRALQEINRVTKKHAYITVDAWRSQQEEENLKKWILTAETALHVDDWKQLFKETDYEGDYSWFIAN